MKDNVVTLAPKKKILTPPPADAFAIDTWAIVMTASSRYAARMYFESALVEEYPLRVLELSKIGSLVCFEDVLDFIIATSTTPDSIARTPYIARFDFCAEPARVYLRVDSIIFCAHMGDRDKEFYTRLIKQGLNRTEKA